MHLLYGRSWTPVFPELRGLLQGERELKLTSGSSSGYQTLDICFLIDCTGSMHQYLRSVKANLIDMCMQVCSWRRQCCCCKPVGLLG
jgi:hypothetical protein